MLTFIFIVDGDGLVAKGLLLAASIKKIYGSSNDIRCIAYMPNKDELSIPELPRQIYKRSGIEFETLDTTKTNWKRAYPHGNKIIAAAAPRETEITVFLDTDTVCVAPLPRLRQLTNKRLALVPDGTPNWGKGDRWARAYDHYKLPMPAATVRLTRRRRKLSPPYFNAGMVAFRENDRVDGRNFAQLWLETAVDFDHNAPIGGKRPWLDQITLPLTMARFGFEYEVLPDSYNYSISNDTFVPPNDGEQFEPEPRLIHYHRMRYLEASTYWATAFRELFEIAKPEERENLAAYCLEYLVSEDAEGKLKYLMDEYR